MYTWWQSSVFNVFKYIYFSEFGLPDLAHSCTWSIIADTTNLDYKRQCCWFTLLGLVLGILITSNVSVLASIIAVSYIYGVMSWLPGIVWQYTKRRCRRWSHGSSMLSPDVMWVVQHKLSLPLMEYLCKRINAIS